MFKSKPIIHILFMILTEFILCYGLTYAISYIASRPDGHVRYVSTVSENGDIEDVLAMAGIKYRDAYERLNYDTQYRIKHEVLKKMTIPYHYTEKEFKNTVWFWTWVVFTISMFLFFFITMFAHDTGDTVASPLFCKILCCLLTILPASVNEPIKTRRLRRQEKITSLLNNFNNYGVK